MSSILKKGMLPVAVAIAMLGVIGAFGGNTRSAEAIQGDICGIYVGDSEGAIEATPNFDGQGNDVYVVAPDTTYGLVFRVQDIIAGWLFAAQFADNLVTDTEDDSFEFAIGGVLPGPNVHVEVDSETGSARITSQAQAYSFENDDEYTIGTYDVEDLWLVPNVTHVLINPGVISQVTQSYSPRYFNNSSGFNLNSINSWLEDHAGMYPFASDDTNVCGASGCGAVDAYFEDSILDIDDGDATPEAGSIVAGTVYPCDDAWGYVDFECIESGYFHIDLRTSDIQWAAMNDLLLPLIDEVLESLDDDIPDFVTPEEVLETILYWNLDPARTGYSAKFYCQGAVDKAEIDANPLTLETNPVGTSKSSSIVTVTAWDASGDRIDGGIVHFTTDNCKFSNPEDGTAGDMGMSPAAGGDSVHMYTDTDSDDDADFLADNPLEHAAGTAEVSLDCAPPAGTPGTATVKAVVERPGADITLEIEITVVGPTAVTGLSLTLTPDEVECGEVILATAEAVDANGAAVSNGTKIYFTTDTSSGVVGGSEGAQGGISTVGGTASVHIATDPGNPGTHTVIAYALKGASGSDIVAQTSATYTCEGAVAPVVPTVAPPSTGTGTGSITPPNTGDAGLAASNGGPMTLIVIAGAVAFVLAGLASVRFARN